MPVNSCTHIKVNGVRCESPALRGQQFCYFHQRIHRSVRFPNSRLHHVAQLENPEAIQASIMEIVNGLLRGTIEVKRAELILRALNIAVRNARRANFEFHSSEMVRDVPHFEPEEDDQPLDQPVTPHPSVHEQIEAVKAAHSGNHPENPAAHAQVDAIGRASVGADAFVRPPSEAKVPAASAAQPPRRKPPVSANDAPAPKERKTTAHRASGG